jgi:O-methyltransferase involved in polyketide biosynthesis
MTRAEKVELGAVQRTLFFPLSARAREMRRRRPLLRDPKALELVQAIDFDPAAYSGRLMSFMVVLRTMIFDAWVSQFLAAHPGGTVVELGTGLNARFERTDDGLVHWVDLDLPDTIDLRRRFFADTERRRMLAASLLDEAWLADVERLPGPYLFVSDGVLVYLTEEQVTGTLARLARRFPGALFTFDAYPARVMAYEHRMAAKTDIPRWQWACDDPRALERFGLKLTESAAVTRPPAAVRARLPLGYRALLPIAHPLLGNGVTLCLFRSTADDAAQAR